MKDSISRGEVRKYVWIDTKQMLADILTKDSVKAADIIAVFRTGVFPRQLGDRVGED